MPLGVPTDDDADAPRGASPRGLALLLVLTLAAGFGLLRLLWLDADPPGYMLDDFITDEGWYSQAARNHALFGRWVMDEHNVPLVLTPGHTLALRAAYAFFGVSFWSTRLVGALSSALTIALVAWGLRLEPVAAAAAAVVLATQPILFTLSRVAFCESLQLCLVATAWLLALDRERRAVSWIAAGAAAGLAVLAKASALYAPVLVLLAPALTRAPSDARRVAREAGLVAVGLALSGLAFLPFLAPFRDLLWIEQGREGSVLWHGVGAPAGIGLPFMLGLHPPVGVLPGFWVGLLPLLAAFGLAAARLLTSSSANRGLTAPARLAWAWLVLSLGFLCLRTAPATRERYWLNLLVPAAVLIGCACAQRHSSESLDRWRIRAAAAAAALGPALLARQALLAVLAQASGEPEPALMRVRFVVPVAILALGLLAVTLARRALLERLAAAGPLWALASASALVGALAIAAPMAAPTYTIRDASRSLAAGLEPRVLTGDLANTLALETPFWAFVHRDLEELHLGRGWVNEDWRALGATAWVSDRPPGELGDRMPAPPGAVLDSSYPVWPDATGRARLTVYVSRLP